MSEQRGAYRPARLSIRATGDSVGNHATVTVNHHTDGSTSVVVEHRQQIATAFLTQREAVALAAALLRPLANDDSAPGGAP